MIDMYQYLAEDPRKFVVKVDDQTQARALALELIKAWMLYFSCGVDLDNFHSRKSNQSYYGLVALLKTLQVCFGGCFEIKPDFDPLFQGSLDCVVSSQGNYHSEAHFTTEPFYFKDTKNNTVGSLALKPQVEIRTKDENLQQLKYILSVSYTFKYGKDFKTKETCSAEKIVQIGQEVSFLDFWHCIKLNFLSLIGSLSFDIVKLQQKIYNKKDKVAAPSLSKTVKKS